MDTYYIELYQNLKGYDQPDTTSSSTISIQKGRYSLVELKVKHPTNDTDYAFIQLASGERKWICLRWKDDEYGKLTRGNDAGGLNIDFSSDPMSIDESVLIDLLPLFNDFIYDLRNTTYPFQLKGINLPQAPPSLNNCCTFVEAIVVGAWQKSHSNFQWDNTKHGQMMIFSDEDYYSPVTCLVNTDMAMEINSDAKPHKWTVIQGWRKQWSGGHTFIILDHHQETDRVLTLESNKAFNLDGVGYRMLGNYRDVKKPTNDWWQDSRLPTWEKIKSTYKFRKQCVLKVNNISWI